MANTKVIAPSNGHGGKNYEKDDKQQLKEDQKAYKALQETIRQHIQMINMALKQYYRQNPHFPRMDKTKFFKWSIDLGEDATRVDVFFRENKLTNEKSVNKGKKPKKAAAMAMSAAPSPELAGEGDEGSLPDVYTYDEVGAPPSGPKEPRRP